MYLFMTPLLKMVKQTFPLPFIGSRLCSETSPTTCMMSVGIPSRVGYQVSGGLSALAFTALRKQPLSHKTSTSEVSSLLTIHFGYSFCLFNRSNDGHCWEQINKAPRRIFPVFFCLDSDFAGYTPGLLHPRRMWNMRSS